MKNIKEITYNIKIYCKVNKFGSIIPYGGCSSIKNDENDEV